MAKIGITYDLKTDWERKDSDPTDVNAEFDKPETLQHVIEALESGGHQVAKIGNIDELLKCLDEIDVDIVFNICEGRAGRNRESQVPMLLEMKGIPYVGSDALTLGITLDKIVAKKMFISAGIPTPRFWEVKSIDDETTLKQVTLPAIVKTRHEGSSKGISQKSRVTDLAALKRQVKFITETYRQPALVEEFIAGTEFTVAVLGNENPKAMPIIQVSINGNKDLGDEVYTNDRIYSPTLKYICPAEIPTKLTKTIQELAVRAYQCVECRDFGRIDFRVDRQGRPYILEINPLPSLDYEDSFNIFPQALGSSYNEALNKVIALALERYKINDSNSSNISDVFEQSLEGV